MASENKMYGNQRIFGDLAVEGISRLPSIVVGRLVMDNGFVLESSNGTKISVNDTGDIYINNKKILVDGDITIPDIDLSGYLPLVGGKISGALEVNSLSAKTITTKTIGCDSIDIGGIKVLVDRKTLLIPTDVMINGYPVYTTNNKPTADDVGAVSIAGGIINGELTIADGLTTSRVKTNETLSITGKTIVLDSTAVVVQSLLRATELYEGINRVYSKANPPPRDTNAVQTNGSTEITGKQRIAEITTDKISIATNAITAANTGFVVSTKSMVFKNIASDSSLPKGTDSIIINPSDGVISLNSIVSKTVSANLFNVLDKGALSSTGSLLKINPKNEHTMVYSGTSLFRHDGIFQLGSNGSILQIDQSGSAVLNGNLSCSHVSVTNNIDVGWGEIASSGFEMGCNATAGTKWLLLAKTLPSKIRFGIQTMDNETRFYQGDSYIRLVNGVLYSKNSTDLDSVPTVGSVKSMIDGFVPVDTTINGKSLNGSIKLVPSDIGAADLKHEHINYLPTIGGELTGSIEFTKPASIKFVGENIQASISSDTAGSLAVSFKTLTFNDCSGNEILQIDDSGSVSVMSELKIGTHVIRHAGNCIVWKGYSTNATISTEIGATYAVSMKKKDSNICYTTTVTKTEHVVGSIDISSVCFTKNEQRLSIELSYLNETTSKFQITDNGIITTDYVITLIKVI